MELHGKVIFITGASLGIGSADARLFAGEGAKLVLTYYKDAAPGKRVAKECLGLGASDVLLLKLNVLDNKSIERAVEATVKKFGRIDILVNNAGVIVWKRLLKQTVSEIELQLRTNLEGVIKMTKSALPHVKKMIINMASAASLSGEHEMIAYSASKWGVRGFTQALAKEGPKLKVHDVISGGVATRMKNFKGLAPETVAQVIVDFAKEKHVLPSGADINVRDYA